MSNLPNFRSLLEKLIRQVAGPKGFSKSDVISKLKANHDDQITLNQDDLNQIALTKIINEVGNHTSKTPTNNGQEDLFGYSSVSLVQSISKSAEALLNKSGDYLTENLTIADIKTLVDHYDNRKVRENKKIKSFRKMIADAKIKVIDDQSSLLDAFPKSKCQLTAFLPAVGRRHRRPPARGMTLRIATE